MKNIIEIDILNCRCNLITNINDGTNLLVLSIKCNPLLEPKLYIDDKKIYITESLFSYEIKENSLIGNGNISFTLVDEHTNHYFTIEKATSSGNLYLKRETDFLYKLQAIKTKESGSVDLSNYYTKVEVVDLVKNPDLKFFKFKYFIDDDHCIIGETKFLGEMVLPKGAYILFLTLSVTGSLRNPPPIKKADLQLDYLKDKIGVPKGSIRMSTIVDINAMGEATRFYESDGKDIVDIILLLETNDIENQMIGELANVTCELEIKAIRVGKTFVQENA